MSAGNRARRARVARLGELASERAEQARVELHRADELVAGADQRRAAALQGAADLASHDVPLALRGHLAGAGARHLVQLADERADLAGEAERCRHELADAVGRVRSLERLVERLDRAAREERARRDALELQDLVAVRAARATREAR